MLCEGMYAVCRSHLCIVNVREYEVQDTFPLQILEQSFTSVLFRDTLEAILLIQRYRKCGDWNWHIPLHLPRRMRIQSSFSYQQWIDIWRSRFEEKTDSILLAR